MTLKKINLVIQVIKLFISGLDKTKEADYKNVILEGGEQKLSLGVLYDRPPGCCCTYTKQP